VLYTLLEDFFIAERFRMDGVVTAVDVTHAGRQLGRHFEAIRQVAMADRLLLTKCDLATPDEIAGVARRLARANPGASQIEVYRGASSAEQVMGCGLYDPGQQDAPMYAAGWPRRKWRPRNARAIGASAMPANRHDALVHAFVLRFEQPLPGRSLPKRLTFCSPPVAIASCASRA
jgi:G3E family GTPase